MLSVADGDSQRINLGLFHEICSFLRIGQQLVQPDVAVVFEFHVKRPHAGQRSVGQRYDISGMAIGPHSVD